MSCLICRRQACNCTPVQIEQALEQSRWQRFKAWLKR